MDPGTNDEQNRLPPLVRPYTVKELAELYCVTPHTIRAWLKPHRLRIGPRIGYFYTVKQVLIIFECIGPPPFSE